VLEGLVDLEEAGDLGGFITDGARATAAARPMPRLAPVTTASLPASQ